ncbi:MAG: Rod shape-determining protein MreD [Deinococcales bacterium]
MFRRLIFMVVLLGLQGSLGVLLPTFLSTPDLFSLVALFVATRVPLFAALCVGYGLGLLQDILGWGLLGFHAAGIMAGVFVSSFVRRGLSAESSLHHAAAVFVALLGKWVVFIALNYWTRQNLISLETLIYRFLPELILTLLIGPVVFAFASWAFGKTNSNHDQLL